LIQLVADATHAQIFAIARAIAAKADVRRECEVVLDAFDVLIAQRLLADGGDGDGHILDGLGAALRRDHNFVDARLLRFLRLRRGSK
jgi:hypothetical protein